MADSKTLLDTWYEGKRPWLSVLLLPVSWLFGLLTALRRGYFRFLARPAALPVPVIVIGNINLGGSGKTPLLIALASRLRETGYRPGIISRGYGSRAPHYPFAVEAATPVAMAGDEPLMIAQRSHCPVVVGADRPAAARHLLEKYSCDLILSDDGLQHYRLPRDLEIIVVDGQRQLGNGRLLPAGPLRESATRLRQADWVVVNGTLVNGTVNGTGKPLNGAPVAPVQMRLEATGWQRLPDGENVGVDELLPTDSARLHALAGIGNPQRFFQTLRDLGVGFIPHPFADHHQFRWQDIHFDDNLPVVMTEKDAVKCRALLRQHAAELNADYWMLRVEARLGEDFYRALDARLKSLERYR